MTPHLIRLRRIVVEVATLLILHALLLRYLAGHDAVSAIFSGGGAHARTTVAIAVFFILIRLLCVLALPGIILSRLGLLIFDYRFPTPATTNPKRNPPRQRPFAALPLALAALVGLSCSRKEVPTMPAPDINHMDHPAILQIVFHPRPDDATPDPQRDVSLPVEEGIHLGGRLHPAADARAPLILFFHGNGEIATDYDDIAPMYNRLGLSFLVVDYRGYGRSNGTPTLSNLVADARAVWDALPNLLAERKLQPARTYVMGRSLGSASALEIGVHAGPALAGLIIESGFAYELELITRLGGPAFNLADDGRQGLGHLSKIERIRVPTLILHGADDWIIPVKDGRALHHHAGAATKRLVIVPGAGHNDLLYIGARDYFTAIRDFTESIASPP